MSGKVSDLWEGASGLAVFLTFGPAVSDKTYISHHDPGGNTHTHTPETKFCGTLS